jgi:hypothetical protein
MVWALKKAPVPANDPVAHLVLIAYADHANDDGTAAWPSVATVAGYARCSPRTVHTKLRLLLDHGLIRPGDQQLVDHLPANRRPVVYDLVMGAPGHREAAATGPIGYETAGQPGVKILHPRTGPLEAVAVDNPESGVKPASPQNTGPVDNPLSGVKPASPQPVDKPEPAVKQASPQETLWGEAGDHSGVKPSADKPPLEPPKKNQGSPPSGTSPAAIHRPTATTPPDRCATHAGHRIPPPCSACADIRRQHEARSALAPDECPHGETRGPHRCALCRRGLLPGIAPWDAQAPPRHAARSA